MNIYYETTNPFFVPIFFSACNTSLTEQGVQRAQDLNTNFGTNKPNRIFVSTLQRTQLTAAPTAAATATGVTSLIYDHQNQDSLNK